MQERHAGNSIAVFHTYPLRVHGDLHQPQAETGQYAGRPQQQGRRGQPAGDNGGGKHKRAHPQNGSASPAIQDPSAGGKGHKACSPQTEKGQSNLRVVRACPPFQRGKAGGKDSVTQAGTNKKIRARRAGGRQFRQSHVLFSLRVFAAACGPPLPAGTFPMKRPGLSR